MDLAVLARGEEDRLALHLCVEDQLFRNLFEIALSDQIAFFVPRFVLELVGIRQPVIQIIFFRNGSLIRLRGLVLTSVLGIRSSVTSSLKIIKD
jgi:hypothetical protein